MEGIGAREADLVSPVKANRIPKNLEQLLLKLVSAFILFAGWWLLSLTLPSDILPGPAPTIAALIKNIVTGQVLGHFLITMARVLSSFVLAMLIGIITGTLMGLFHKVEAMSDIWVMVAMTIPGLCYVIVSFMWFGLNEFSAIVAITLTSYPTITINIWESVKNIDNKLIDMSKVFNASRSKRIIGVVIPQVLPYIVASARFGLGTIWKVTVLVELLGRSSGVGYMLNYWFQMYNMAQVLAWTLLFSIIMLFLEVVVLKQIEMRLFAWRPAIKF